mmetsp:Transcript_26166/g.49113  ORF Transcript_26166/g.49113 Transcript_26166/m.49113 type:complete len:350 (+) Transcript_26166:933-1982(+)
MQVCSSAGVMMGVAEDVQGYTTSASCTEDHSCSMWRYSMCMSLNSSCSFSTRSGERLTTVTVRTFFDFRCTSSSLAILPAPTITTLEFVSDLVGSNVSSPATSCCTCWLRCWSACCCILSAVNSTAADDTLTAPLQISVSLRTRLPTRSADSNICLSTSPPLPSSAQLRVKAFFTWHWICASPSTILSSPADTRMRWKIASSPVSTNMCLRRVSWSTVPSVRACRNCRASVIASYSFLPATYTSKRLQVLRTKASSIESASHKEEEASFHCSSGIASCSRTSTGQCRCETPMTTISGRCCRASLRLVRSAPSRVSDDDRATLLFFFVLLFMGEPFGAGGASRGNEPRPM